MKTDWSYEKEKWKKWNENRKVDKTNKFENKILIY